MLANRAGALFHAVPSRKTSSRRVPARALPSRASASPRRDEASMGTSPAKLRASSAPGSSGAFRSSPPRFGAIADDAVLAPQSPASPSADGDPFSANFGSVMLQGFHWRSCSFGDNNDRSWYAEVRDKVWQMRAAGVDAVWLPPPSHSVAPEGYLPQRLYDLNTPYGTKEELKALCAELKAAGIAPIADIVINHRCADTQDENGQWRIFSNVTFPDGPPDDKAPGKIFDKSWGPWAIVKDDPNFPGEGGSDTGEVFPPAPDLDHSNERVRRELTAWLTWLKDEIGFLGWRFDYVKGYGARFVREYAERSVGLGALNVAEFWPDASWEPDGTLSADQNPMRQRICDWLDAAGGATAAFDFTTKAVLQEAVSRTQYWRLRDAQGKPPGLIGWWPQRAVTFIDNHDTGGTGQAAGFEQGRMKDGTLGSSVPADGSYGQGHWRFPPEHRLVGYAYILTHPGIPCLFWPHAMWFDEKHVAFSEEVASLVAVRRAAGVRADSDVTVFVAEDDVYAALVRGAVATLAVKLGPRYDVPEGLLEGGEGAWEAVASGHEYAVWSRPNNEASAR